MLSRIIKCLKRAPVPAFAVLLFAAIISVIICTVEESNEAEVRNYEETYQSIPVTVTVTEPSGIKTDTLIINPWVLDLFIGENIVEVLDLSAAENEKEKTDLIIDGGAPTIEISFTEYIKDIRVKASRMIDLLNNEYFGDRDLFGITSLYCDKLLLPENGCEITWKDGYDESVFGSEERVCIVPESMVEIYDNGKGDTVLDFSGMRFVTTLTDGKYHTVPEESKYQCTLKIVGSYTAGDETSIYCPYPIIEQVYNELGENPIIWSLSATITDNSRLNEFREKISVCFTEPSSNAEKTPWGCTVKYRNNYSIDYEFYPYALDIGDENLINLAKILEESIKFNRMITVIILAISVAAGFLIGFLMVRRRKREIMLMRMVGESNFRVYFGFAVEQMICILLGIAVGGAYYNWNPINNLVIFAVAYFIALTIALVIFMSKKLIKNVKEDE